MLIHLTYKQNQIYLNLKAEVDEIVIDNIKTVSADLNKPSNGVG